MRAIFRYIVTKTKKKKQGPEIPWTRTKGRKQKKNMCGETKMKKKYPTQRRLFAKKKKYQPAKNKHPMS